MTVIIFFTVLSIASSLLTATFIALPLYLFFRKNGILIQPYPELTECNFEDFEAAPTTPQHSPLTKGRKEEGLSLSDQRSEYLEHMKFLRRWAELRVIEIEQEARHA